MADVSKELGLEPVHLFEPLIEDAQLLRLAGYLLFGALTLSDIPALRE
jgi:hypothetical protein